MITLQYKNNYNLKQTYLKKKNKKLSNLGSNKRSKMKCGWNWWKMSYLWKKSWAKITIGISFYCWKTKLAIWPKSGQNLTIGLSYSRWGSTLVVGSHPDSIWTIGCTVYWPLELGPDLDRQVNMRKLGAIELEDQESREKALIFFKKSMKHH